MEVQEVLNFVVEKLNEALAWFDNVFPPDIRDDMIYHWFRMDLPFLVAAVVLTAIVCCCRCLCRCCCGGGGGGGGWRVIRMTKAPGRNRRMPRSVFENDPEGYFTFLHRFNQEQRSVIC